MDVFLEDFMIHVICIAVFVAIILHILGRIAKWKADIVEDEKVLDYLLPTRVLLFLLSFLGPFSFYVAMYIWKDREYLTPFREYSTLFVGVGMLLLSIFLIYQIFFVKLSYTQDYFRLRSPLKGDKKVPWTDINYIGDSMITLSPFIQFNSIGRVYINYMSNGFGEFGGFLGDKHDELFPPNSDT